MPKLNKAKARKKAPKLAPKKPTGVRVKKAKASKAKSPKRSYNNEKRLEKTKAISQIVIQTLVDLLVEKRGGDVQFIEISKKSKVPMRTIFRLFKDKQALHEAMDEYLLSYIRTSMNQLEQSTFLDFSEKVFGAYDKFESRVIAYLFSPFGHQARDILRKRFNQVLLSQILKEHPLLKVDMQNRNRLALVTTLVNAKLWYDLKTDFGLSGVEIGRTVKWALEVLIREIEANKK